MEKDGLIYDVIWQGVNWGRLVVIVELFEYCCLIRGFD